MKRQHARLLFILVLLLAIVVPVTAQSEGPVVYGVLFFSPTCPHCHELIDNTLPPIQEEFGDSLQIIIINIQTQGGNAIAMAAYETYNIPRERWVVPMMVIDNQVLIGGAEIPAKLPQITQDGLARGGIELPPIPGLAEAYAAAMASVEPQPETSTAETSAAAPDVTPQLSMMERLAADPIANAAAVLVLIGLVVSLFALVLLRKSTQQPTLIAARITLLATVLVSGSIVLQTSGDTLATLASWGVLSLVGLAFIIVMVEGEYLKWAVPAITAAGLLVALYLSYVETTAAAAACGVVGNCNAVQQSDYAVLLGLLPVGVLGVIGYVAIFIAWWITLVRDEPLAKAALAIMTLGGIVFSIYLTFLEPFVIGATCAWCLTSALTMLALAWLLVPEGLAVLMKDDAKPLSAQKTQSSN